MSQTVSIQSVISSTFPDDYGSNNTSGSNTNNYGLPGYEEDADIMRWLSPLEPNSRHHSLRSERFGDVGDWLLQTSEYREWRGGEGGSDGGVLLCSGGPGVGKTFLR